MNNPLRFKGETFYQTGHQDLGGGKEMTTLSVVNNQGWMLPYIACMIAMFGMFAQFGQTLFRFLDRDGAESHQLATVAVECSSFEPATGLWSGAIRSEAGGDRGISTCGTIDPVYSEVSEFPSL